MSDERVIDVLRTRAETCDEEGATEAAKAYRGAIDVVHRSRDPTVSTLERIAAELAYQNAVYTHFAELMTPGRYTPEAFVDEIELYREVRLRK